MNDYEEAMALFDKIITSEPNIDCPGPHAADALYFSAMLAADRANIYENPEYFEEAIYRHRRIPSTDNFWRSSITQFLAGLIKWRPSHFGITGEGLPEARSLDPEVTSFGHLFAPDPPLTTLTGGRFQKRG